jgi:hypothetical protein
VNATRSEGIFCSAPSNAESFRFKVDLLGDFKTERNTDQLSRCGSEGVGFAEDVGKLLGLVETNLSLEMRKRRGHSHHKIIEGFAVEFKLQLDRSRFDVLRLEGSDMGV